MKLVNRAIFRIFSVFAAGVVVGAGADAVEIPSNQDLLMSNVKRIFIFESLIKVCDFII